MAGFDHTYSSLLNIEDLMSGFLDYLEPEKEPSLNATTPVSRSPDLYNFDFDVFIAAPIDEKVQKSNSANLDNFIFDASAAPPIDETIQISNSTNLDNFIFDASVAPPIDKTNPAFNSVKINSCKFDASVAGPVNETSPVSKTSSISLHNFDFDAFFAATVENKSSDFYNEDYINIKLEDNFNFSNASSKNLLSHQAVTTTHEIIEPALRSDVFVSTYSPLHQSVNLGLHSVLAEGHYESRDSFEQDHKEILEKELQQLNQRKLEQQTDQAFERLKCWLENGKPSAREGANKNSRSSNIANFDPAQFYQQLSEPPASWGSPDPVNGQPIFQYNAQGELTPHTKFSADQISEYISNHYLHSFNHLDTTSKPCGLTLWLQICPADSGKRYPTAQSSKCRFKSCPVSNNTIRKGEYRVAFDEQAWKNEPLDPYHNAGYVHLFCLEKQFDFPKLCKDFNLRGDTRVFPEGRNKMAITRDFPVMEKIIDDFIKESKPWDGKRPADYYEFTLCHALTKEHLQREPKKRQSVREKRDGNSVDRHLNNLDVMAQNIEMRKQNLALKAPKKPKARKRKQIEEDGNDSVLDDNILWKRPRPERRYNTYKGGYS